MSMQQWEKNIKSLATGGFVFMQAQAVSELGTFGIF